MSFGAPSVPAPYVPPPVPTAVNPTVRDAFAAFRQGQGRTMGRQSTILTSGLGAMLTGGQTKTAQLLGQ